MIKKEPIAGDASNLCMASLTYSTDGKRIAYMFLSIVPATGGVEGKCTVRVVVDGAADKEYDQIQSPHDDPMEGEIKFSPDGKHYAYAARKGRRWLVVQDGREHAPWDRIMGPAFSPDGKSLIYGTEKGNEHYLVLDEKIIGPFDGPPLPTYSADGLKLAYYASKGGKTCYVVDGKEQCPKDGIVLGTFMWSRAGDHYAYQISNGAGEQRLVLDGVTGKALAEIQDFKFSPDGKRHAYGYRSPEGWRAVIDGKESGPSLMIPRVRFSPDGAHVAYTASRSTEAFVVVDGKEGAPYHGIRCPVFSPDGQHMAYAALKPDRTEVVVMDGKEIYAQPPGRPMQFTFSAEWPEVGVHFRPLFCGGAASPVLWHPDPLDSFAVVDGKAGSVYQGLSPLRRGTIPKGWSDELEDAIEVFSPDCRRIAYAVQKRAGVMAMVLDGKEGKEYWTIGGARFSPDGQYLVYVGNTRKEAFVVLNGAESEPYEKILSPIYFDDPSSFHYFAKQNGKIYRILESVPEISR